MDLRLTALLLLLLELLIGGAVNTPSDATAVGGGTVAVAYDGTPPPKP